MNHSTEDFRLNSSGYYDPTAYKAMKNIERSVENDEIYARKKKCIKSIFKVAEVLGFTIKGRITLCDKKTGRILY